MDLKKGTGTDFPGTFSGTFHFQKLNTIFYLIKKGMDLVKVTGKSGPGMDLVKGTDFPVPGMDLVKIPD